MEFDEVARRGLVLLGCGKMGGAMLDGWLAGGLPASAVTVLDPKPSAGLEARVSAGLNLNGELPADPAVAILAVKPQMMGAALPQLAALGGGGTLFVSIAAGTTLATLGDALGAGTPIVRAMPNTPAAVGRGITALIGNASVDAAGLDLAENLLSAVGRTVRIDTESEIDAITALSGSGPAYVFLLIEAMAAAGVAQGLAPELAQSLARATVIGAGALAESAAETPAAQLRTDVTSPGGTTAAALQVLMADEGLVDLMSRAIAAAAARSRELAV
ncbi:pyrroline-5-carboxylate reductase [Amaricoccus macauensis]|uniref:Pyrroline-5-carboxylate reductase n=1 Tax=Amaricoccus macauensis TaxID=57001 RepID=A0A840SQH3_9RHOB|nr:pyrroline-5-carboxylate reductase [Amaricoccus macauensis]MBB5222106.1 pyrroline-5-carboxylate reductase [Amaricoccus macauensis]